MSDSDQNERGRLPWWLKPLAGGDSSKKTEETDSEASESEEAESLSAAEAAPEGDAPSAAVEADGDDDPGDDAGEEANDDLFDDDDAEDDDVEDEDEDEESDDESDDDESEDDESEEDEADDGDDGASPAEKASGGSSRSGRSRGRRRGRRGGKKKNGNKNGNTGRKRAESPPPAVSFPAPEPEGVIELLPVPERTLSVNDVERNLGVFCDFENIALGVRDSEIKRFDITIVLERLLDKGKILVKKAYADWERYSDYKRKFHESAIELIDIPQKYYSGKNSADIKMVVDAMEISYTKDHLDTFVVMSGDSDFSPLVSKLKENNKHVIGVGVKNSSSNLLVDNCDEFIYYEDIWRDMKRGGPAVSSGGSKNAKSTEAFTLLVNSIKALMRDNKDVLWGSMIKQTMQRKKPSFNEGYYGYSTFSELLEDAERQKLVRLKKDQRSGTYIVTGYAGGR